MQFATADTLHRIGKGGLGERRCEKIIIFMCRTIPEPIKIDSAIEGV